MKKDRDLNIQVHDVFDHMEKEDERVVEKLNLAEHEQSTENAYDMISTDQNNLCRCSHVLRKTVVKTECTCPGD